MLRVALLYVMFFPFAAAALGQPPSPAIKAWVTAHQQPIFAEYLQLVSTPDVHGDLPALERNATLLAQMLDQRSMHAEIWKTPGAPVVFGQRVVPGAKRTILFYIHYDGQPVQPQRWAQADPFTPVLRDGSLEANGRTIASPHTLTSFPPDARLYARAAADDKGPIEAFVAALDALDALHQPVASNIKIILDGEEEGGGPGLAAVLAEHAPALQANLMILLDGPQHPSGHATVYYGARGGTGLDLTVFTAASALHSGNYGNWMPDANLRMAHLLASMTDQSGKVTIPGFYSDLAPFSPAVRAMFAAIPDDSATMQKRYGVAQLDGAAASLQEALNLPSLSVHTLQGGEAGGVIAARSSAQIAMRLVPEDDPQTMIDRVVAHVKGQGYFVVDHDPDLTTLNAHPLVAKITYRAASEPAGGAWRTDPSLPEAQFVRNAVQAGSEVNVIEIRTLGGSVPAGPFIRALHVPVIGISLVNYDDNQHTDNENLRLANLWDGIVTLASVMSHP